jgi:hypothetical protein
MNKQKSYDPRSDISIHPPKITVNPNVSFTVRYEATAAQAAVPITYVGLFLMLASKSAVTTVAGINSYFESVRFRRIRIWGPSVVAGGAVSANTIGFEFAVNVGGLFGNKTTRYTDSSTSTAINPFIQAKPVKGELADQWYGPSTTAVTSGLPVGFITCPSGTIVDITIDGVLSGGDVYSYSSVSVTALAAGVYSYTFASSFIPTDYNTFT